MIQQLKDHFNRAVGFHRNDIPRRRWLVQSALMVLALTILACNLVTIGSQPTPERIVRSYKLLPPVTPTKSELIAAVITPTSVVTSTVTLEVVPTIPPTPTFTPELALSVTEPTAVPPTLTFTPTSEPTATATLTPTLTPTPPAEWAFANIRLDTSQYEDDLLFYGNVINNTDTAQMIAFISGIFYDDQDQVVADEQDTYDYWLVDVIPPKAQIPFELTVADVQSVSRYDFLVEAEPGGESKSSEFEFVNVQANTDTGDYCLEGELKNIGQTIDDFITVIATLYDDQDSVINFSDDELFGPFNNGEGGEFYICVDPLGHQVARHELQAWGE